MSTTTKATVVMKPMRYADGTRRDSFMDAGTRVVDVIDWDGRLHRCALWYEKGCWWMHSTTFELVNLGSHLTAAKAKARTIMNREEDEARKDAA